MTNFIPIFPLSLVVFPNEICRLHIFEPRYKQLIAVSVEQNKPFGIPTVIDNKMMEWGTLVQVHQVLKKYDDGKMDIEVKGVAVFTMLEPIATIPNKLYSGAIASYPEVIKNGKASIMQKVLEKLKELHTLLQVTKEFNKPEKDLTIFDIAHYAGLSLQQEYELLQLTQELHQQEYLKRYLTKKLTELNLVLQTNDSSKSLKEFMGFSLN